MIPKRSTLEKGLWIVFDHEPNATEIYQACLYSFEMIKAITKIIFKRKFDKQSCLLVVYNEYHKRYRPKKTPSNFLEEIQQAEILLDIAGKLDSIHAETANTIRGLLNYHKQREAITSLASKSFLPN